MIPNHHCPVGRFSVSTVFHSSAMHRHHSVHTLKSLHRAAYHFLANIVLALAGVGMLGYGVYLHDHFWAVLGACTLGLWLLSTGLFFIQRSSLRCPLCLVPVWAGKKCQKHRKAKPALGISYRLGVAVAVIFRGHYRCPYCGEPFSSREVRKR